MTIEYEEFKEILRLLCVIAAVSLTVTACEGDSAAKASVAADVAHAANILESLAEAAENSRRRKRGGQEIKRHQGWQETRRRPENSRLSDIPEYTDSPYVAVNGNVPYFTEDDLTAVYTDATVILDSWKSLRCGLRLRQYRYDTATGKSGIPSEEQKPTGWINAKYDFVDGKYHITDAPL